MIEGWGKRRCQRSKTRVKSRCFAAEPAYGLWDESGIKGNIDRYSQNQDAHRNRLVAPSDMVVVVCGPLNDHRSIVADPGQPANSSSGLPTNLVQLPALMVAQEPAERMLVYLMQYVAEFFVVAAA
jgi:hypothetical protein